MENPTLATIPSGRMGLPGLYFHPLIFVFTEAWASVLWELQEQRSKLDLPFVPHSADSCYQQFGLTHPLVVQLLEQLPHANRCSGYEFSYHKPSEMTSWRAHVSVGVANTFELKMNTVHATRQNHFSPQTCQRAATFEI